MVLKERVLSPFAVLKAPVVFEKRALNPFAVLPETFPPPRPTVSPFIFASAPLRVNRASGVDVPIPTLAPFPRMTVLDCASETRAPTAVAFDIFPTEYVVSDQRNVL